MKKNNKISVKDIVARIDNDHKWKGNILQKIAEEVVRYAIPIEEVMKIDLSEKILKELEREIINKEIISLQINAKPRMAKSTLAIALSMFIDSVLKKHGMKEEKIAFGMRNIARDQNEKVKKMREPELMFDVIMTDESNALEDTGENSTAEKAQRDVYSDIQAGRYIHGIWVCPEGTMDKNCDIKLEIRNKDNGLIHTRVYYYSKSQYYLGWVLIGTADFDVSKIIKKWLEIEPIFFRYLKLGKSEDKKVIDYWTKRDFYIEYMVKKYEKMELMNREGILHARDLDYADIRKNVVESMRPLAELSFISMQRLKNNVKSKIETEFKKKKMPLTILGKEIEYERIIGALEMYRSLVEIKISVKSLLKRYQEGKISKEEYEKIIPVLKTAQSEIENEINISEAYLKRMEELNKRYNSHLIQ